MYSDVITGLTPNVVATFITKLNELHTLIGPCLVKLSPEQRSALPVVGDRRYSFVAKAFRLGEQHQYLFPTFRDYNTFKRIHYDFVQMQALVDRLRSFVEAMSDTLLQIGANNFDTALIFYSMTETASKSDQPGTQVIYRDLARHFARINGAEEDNTGDQGNLKSPDNNPEEGGPAPAPEV